MDNYFVNVNKKVIALCMVFAILVGFIPFLSTNVYASGVDNITARADYLYNILWTAQKDVKGWGNATTFKQGTTHHIPYGQPVNSGKFICWGATIITFAN